MQSTTQDARVTSNEAANETSLLLRKFRIIFNAVKRQFQDLEMHTGISGAQLWALNLIAERPRLRVSELARAMDVRQPTASALVKALATKQLVISERGKRDKRSVELSVSPAGRRILRRAPAPANGLLPQAIAALEAPTVRRLNRDLERLIDAMPMDRKEPWTPLGS